jgi:dihydroneopterin aldolase
MSDKISIQGLEVWTRIGVPEEERARPQKLEINASFEVETVPEAARFDEVDLTVNYFDVAQAIRRIAESKERKLIETLAEDLASELLSEFGLKEIEVEIRKFIIPDCRYVGLKIKRKRRKKKASAADSKDLD